MKRAIPFRIKCIFWLHFLAPKRFTLWHMTTLDKATTDLLLEYMAGPFPEKSP